SYRLTTLDHRFAVTRRRRVRTAAFALACAGIVLAFAAVTRSASERAPLLGTRERCARFSGVPEGFARAPHAGMVWIAGGAFTPGSQHGYPEERGGGTMEVAGFWIDRT